MKHSFGGKKIFNRDIWFLVHQTHTILALLCTLTGFIVIAIEKGVLEYSQDYLTYISPHPIIGFVVLVLTLLQPTFALFRPGSRSPMYVNQTIMP
jgi:cytochrome b561